MQNVLDRALAAPSGSRPVRRDNLVVLLPALLSLVIGGLVQAQTYLNHDVAWVLNSSERLLHGGTFGRDIVAANPPLIWWLSALVAGLAGLIGADPIVTFRAVVLLLIAGVLLVLNRGLARVMDDRARAIFLTIVALLLTIGVHRDFGQREHLAVVLCLPWLLFVAGNAPNHSKAALAGFVAGIGICFKPHFLAVPLLVWAFVALRDRSLRPVLRLDSVAIVLTGLTYLVAAWFFARPYLTEVLPLISQVYWGFEYPLVAVVANNPLPVLLAPAALTVAWQSGWRTAPTIPALASVGFLSAALAQSKGYSYHFYPVLFFALVSITLAALTKSRACNRIVALLSLGAGLLLTIVQAAPALTYRSASGAYGQQTACLVSLVQENVPESGGFMAFSTHPYPGFPVANYSHRRWIAATNSRLFLPAIARLRAKIGLSPEAARVLTLAETSERAAALKEMANRPELVLVDAQKSRHAIGRLPVDFIAFYTEDTAFARIWSDYQEIYSCAPSIRVFKLSEET